MVEKDGEATGTGKQGEAHGDLASSAFAPPLPAGDAGVPTGSSAPRRLVRSGNNAQNGLGAGAGSAMVNLTPLMAGRGGPNSNVNPAMNAAPAQPGQVQIMNMLDVPQASASLDQFAMTDSNFLEGMPGQMFDWGQ